MQSDHFTKKQRWLWKDNHPRNKVIIALNKGIFAQWKQENSYHLRLSSEAAMYRYKQLISPKLSLRGYNAQVGEALADVKAMDKVIRLDMLIREQTA
tara:strand:+ start:1207 stop:1497 length:291 start_codon:yes stop_codon:yes gene_type:complete